MALWNYAKSTQTETQHIDHEPASLPSRVDGEEENCNQTFIEPILSWKAHGGRWIADAKFLPKKDVMTTTPTRLLTAANDGCVCLWDLTTVSARTGVPKLLSTTGKKFHTGGIFSMDVSIASSGRGDNYVCTGSKDKTVTVTKVNSVISRGNNCQPDFVSDYHRGKVGCVHMQQNQGDVDKGGGNSSLVASASDDGSVALHDFRMDGRGGGEGGVANKVAAVKNDAHVRPHSVTWHPTHQHDLVTGVFINFICFDKQIKLVQ